MALSGAERTALVTLLTIGKILVTLLLRVVPLRFTVPRTFKVTLAVRKLASEPSVSQTRIEMIPGTVILNSMEDMVTVSAWVAVTSASTEAFGY